MIRPVHWMLGLLLLLFALPGAAQTKPYTPKPGSTERKALMDALRIPVERELKQKVIFEVQHLKVLKDWAFMRGRPLQPNSKPIDYKGTEHEEAIKEGAFDDGIAALLHRRNGKWTVTIHEIGATDVAWDDWDKRFKAPTVIFK